jgi:hypothetical protein
MALGDTEILFQIYKVVGGGEGEFFTNFPLAFYGNSSRHIYMVNIRKIIAMCLSETSLAVCK